jgi:putative transposase
VERPSALSLRTSSRSLCTNMRAEDVTDTLDLALRSSGCDQVHVVHKPRLLSDNGSSYVSGDLAEWLQDKGMKHSRGAPYHPQTQGKIERWHQTLKNRNLLENYFLPGDLEAQIEAFVHHYNHQRYHESINNVTPADAKVPASFAGIADLLRVLKHLKFALNVAFFVRHEYFLHPK